MKPLNLRQVFVDISSTAGRQILSSLISLITQILIARFCGPRGSGLIAVALLLPTSLQLLLNIGIGSANIYFIASSQISLANAWRTNKKFGVIISSLALTIGILIIIFGNKYFNGIPRVSLYIALASLPPALFNELLTSIFQARKNFSVFNSITLFQPFLQLGLVSALLSLGVRDPSWILAINLLSISISLLVALIILKQEISLSNDSPITSLGFRYFTYGLKSHLTNIVAFLNYKADIFIVNIFLGTSDAGLYTIAVSISERLWILSQASSSVILPHLSELSKDEDGRQQLTPIVSRTVFAITSILGFIMLILVPFFIPLLFGQKFSGAILPLIVLIPGIVLGSVSRVLASDIAARGRPELNLLTSLLVLFFNVAGNLFLVPLMGLSGAALATTLSYALNLALRLGMYYRFTGVSPLRNLIIQSSDINKFKSLLTNSKLFGSV